MVYYGEGNRIKNSAIAKDFYFLCVGNVAKKRERIYLYIQKSACVLKEARTEGR